MGIGDRIRAAWQALRGERKAYDWSVTTGGGNDILTHVNGNPKWSITSIQAFIDEGYETNALVRAAIDYRSEAALTAPLRAYTGTRDNPTPLPYDSDLARLLDRPNRWQSQAELLMMALGYFPLTGNAYILLDRDLDDTVRGMYCLRPDKVEIILEETRDNPLGYTLKGYAYFPTQSKRDVIGIPPADMMHIKSPNFSDAQAGLAPGTPPLRAAARIVDVDNAYTSYLKIFFERGAVPSGILTYSQPISGQVANEVEEKFTEKFGGFTKWIRPLVTGPDAKWERLGVSFEEMNAEGLDMRNEVRILSALGVPPILVGSRVGLMRSTYSNYEEARKAFWQDKQIPLLRLFESEFRYYLRGEDGEFAKFDLAEVPALEELRRHRVAEIREAWQSSAATRSEYRAVLGLTVDERDEVYRASGNVLFIPANPEVEESEEGAAEAIEEEDDDRKALPGPQVKASAYLPEFRKRLYKQIDGTALEWETEAAQAAAEAFDLDKRAVMAVVMATRTKAYERKQTPDWEESAAEVEAYFADESGQNWSAVLIPILSGVVLQQAEQLSREFGRAFDADELLASQWFADYVATFADPITVTSWEEMAVLFAEAQNEGWSIEQMTENLDTLFQQWIQGDQRRRLEGMTEEERQRQYFAEERLPPYRRELIARDQTLRASNAGNFALYQQWGVDEKEWLATLDGRVRDAHAAADGQVVPMDEPFDVGGELMMYPGDSSLGASLGNVIQCRCTTIPVIPGVT